jgi:hypothetical protein
MNLDGTKGATRLRGDLLVEESGDDAREDLALAGSESVQAG